MKRTYTRTLMIEDLTQATFEVEVYDKQKHCPSSKIVATATYTGVESWDIIEGGEEAEDIESMTDANSIDENHEYVVLHFNDGTESTFRNSHVDIFIR